MPGSPSRVTSHFSPLGATLYATIAMIDILARRIQRTKRRLAYRSSSNASGQENLGLSCRSAASIPGALPR
jgi:hypothetical protein